MEELVSIIVPVYNVSNYIEECVLSLLGQDYKNIEVILVNDGSTDNSFEIINRFISIDSRIKVINKANGGVSSARNAGLREAHGEFICFVDGDDYVSNDYVSYLKQLIEQDNCDISLTKSQFTNYNNVQIKKDSKYVVSGTQAAIDLLCRKITIGVYCKMFKKAFLDANKILFYEEIFIGEGFNFNMLAFQNATKVSVGYRKIYFYRINNPTSAMTLFSEKKAYNELLAMNYIFNNLKNEKKLIRAFDFGNWRTYSDVYCNLIIVNGKEKYLELYNKTRKVIRKGFYFSLRTNTSLKEKIRALLFLFIPNYVPKKQIKKRNKEKLFNCDAKKIASGE